MRLAALCLSCLLLPALAVAALPDELQQKVQGLAKESDSLLKQRHKWEGVQDALLAQKKQIEATQKDVLQQEDTLNQKNTSHNQQIAAQQQRIQKGGCGSKDNDSGVSGGDLATAQCDKDAKALNKSSADLNAETAGLQSEQAKLDAQYAQANQDASDWNAHESMATENLNGVYRSMNDWLDRAYEVIINGEFRDEVTALNADSYCENRGLPTGTLSIPTLVRLSDSYRKCLKYVLSAEQKPVVPAPAH